jgi:hypothetical protein
MICNLDKQIEGASDLKIQKMTMFVLWLRVICQWDGLATVILVVLGTWQGSRNKTLP